MEKIYKKMNKEKIKEKIQKYVNFEDKESKDELNNMLNKLYESEEEVEDRLFCDKCKLKITFRKCYDLDYGLVDEKDDGFWHSSKVDNIRLCTKCFKKFKEFIK